jgi:hypothetical protein
MSGGKKIMSVLLTYEKSIPSESVRRLEEVVIKVFVTSNEAPGLGVQLSGRALTSHV